MPAPKEKGNPPAKPLIALRSYQQEAFWSEHGVMFWLWRRQAGKSFTAASKALRRMMEIRGLSSFFVSASVALGTEFVRKEAEVWAKVIEAMRQLAASQDLQLESNADGLDLDAVCDLFEHQKLETKIWHDRTTYSRSRVIAPNPDTAVGWTGDIWMDEFGRMPEFQAVLEAVLPFMSSNPQFRLLGITTPPPDDAHYSWELVLPQQEEFEINARGNWYRSQAGYLVHRVDAWDAFAAGVPMYDDETRAALTPEEHRKKAFDKTAWDRNFGLRFVAGGTAALSAASLLVAMERGKTLCRANNVTEEVAA